MQYRLCLVLLVVVGITISACAAPTAVPPTPQPAAPTAVIATTAPTAAATIPPTPVPSTAAPTAAVATTAPTAVRTSVPTPVPTSSAQPTQAQPTAASKGGTKLDLNVLVPPGDGRDLVMENCMACHSIAPTLVSQKTAGEWQGTMVNHRSNMGGVSDADYKKMTDYLVKFFGPDHKIPDLPKELLDGWTNY